MGFAVAEDQEFVLPPLEERPLVTFALFAYNQEKYIREAVEGAFAQTYEPLEIILSDDCSTDRTFEIMEEMAAGYTGKHSIHLRRGVRNLGLAGHINAVLGMSAGQIISWAAGDDVALPERTTIFVSKLLESNVFIGVHSNVEEIDLEGNFLRYRSHSQTEANTALQAVIESGQSVITQSHAFWKSAFDTFGAFREDLTQEGIAMAFRETLLGNVAFVDLPLTKYRIGSGVSTYSGGNLKKSKILEPIKYTQWYLSAFRQMLEDSSKSPRPLSSHQKTILLNNVRFYSSLLSINKGQNIFRSLFRNLLLRPRDTKSIRAAVRRVLPDFIYKITLP